MFGDYTNELMYPPSLNIRNEYQFMYPPEAGENPHLQEENPMEL